jgi:hypothetical protein
MSHPSKNLLSLLAVAIVALTTSLANAAFTSFIIRNDGGGNPPTIQPNNTYVPSATEFVISAGGQKAAWGSSDIDGAAIGDITNVSVTRHDPTGRFNAGSGPAVAPYFNIWVTDGMGQYAVLANEPSNGSFQPLFVTNMDGSKTYSLSFSDLAAEPVKVYETLNGGGSSTTTWVHNLFGNMPLTFADVASLTIEAPSAAYITGGNNVGSGAPRELGTNVAYGFNWVFGDTLANYVSGMETDEGYVVSNPFAAAVPEPSSLLLLGSVVSFFAVRRRRAV